MRLALALLVGLSGQAFGADCPTPPTKPTQGVACTDPETGYSIKRVTNWSSDGASYLLRNDYSRRDPFNADQTRAFFYSIDGSWHLYNITTSTRIKTLSGVVGDAEPIWDDVDTTQFYFLPPNGGLVLKRYDIDDDSVVNVANFAGRLPWAGVTYCSTGSEGSPSADRRYWGFQCRDSGFGMLGVFTYDLQTDTIIATLTTSEGTNYTSMSPSGTYFVGAWWTEQIVQGEEGRVRAYLRDLSDWTWVDCVQQHSDMALGTNGHDYYISVDHSSGGGSFACSPANGQVFTRDIQAGFVSQDIAGSRIDHFGTYYGGGVIAGGAHFSGKSFNLPGRFIWGSYACSGAAACAHAWADSVMMGDLVTPGAMVKVANINTVWASYNTEPHPAIAASGTKAIFNSTWGNSGDNAIDIYTVDLPTAFGITTTTLPNGTNGQAYQQDAETSGGTQPVTACITSAGALPTGASWSVQGSACRLSDASIETGTYNFTLQATDSNSNTDTQAFTLSVVATLQINTTTLADGTISSGYSPCLEASGGTPAYSFSVVSGSVPTGLTLASSGCFTGTASSGGTFNFTARVTDSLSATDDQALSLTITSGGTLTMRAPIIYASDTYATFRLGAVGLDYTADCAAIVRDNGGAVVDTITSASGPAVRDLAITGLTAASNYSATFTCDGATPDVTPYPFVTLAAATGGARTVPLQFGAPSSLLIGAARLTVEYDDNPALSTPASSQNTSCGSGCTVNLSLGAGLWYYRWIWQTAADATLATSAIQALPIP